MQKNVIILKIKNKKKEIFAKTMMFYLLFGRSI